MSRYLRQGLSHVDDIVSRIAYKDVSELADTIMNEVWQEQDDDEDEEMTWRSIRSTDQFFDMMDVDVTAS